VGIPIAARNHHHLLTMMHSLNQGFRTMLSTTDAAIVKRLKNELKRITPIVRLVAYGSRARGDATPESDLDVFIEVPKLSSDLRKKFSEVAREVSLDAEVVISTFVATTDGVKDGPLSADPILKSINLEGIAV
jgi:predicted nucleotidyltransferase